MKTKFDYHSYVENGLKIKFSDLNNNERWLIIHEILHGLICIFSDGNIESIAARRVFGTNDGHRLWNTQFYFEDSRVPIQFIANDLDIERSSRLDLNTKLVPLCKMCTLRMNRGSRLIEKYLLLGVDYPFHFVELRRYMKLEMSPHGYLLGSDSVSRITFSHVTRDYIIRTLREHPDVGVDIIKAIGHLLKIAIENKSKEIQFYQQRLNYVSEISSRLVGL